ncbi:MULTISPECIES: hypothetical protein [Hymenobacter]|uniref:Immunity protein 35 domain-containing protein n=2 Tax=Hymenobacter TaxID=89966 RepID=A0A7Y7PR12_9BACT|nr:MULTISPECIES: hypothetical protein [Hymenobacter]NVO32315.1 hypothetical protein [Hymenobacter lapidiphilus]OWP61368.1 hypothetical protein CDA63_19775 [Hymenobacter amundsenii]
MTKEQAIAIATGFVAQQNQDSSLPAAYHWVVGKPVEHEEGWYFDHVFGLRPGQLAVEPLLLGGAPGFLVCKSTQRIRTISWKELPELPLQDALRKQAVQQAENLLAAGLTLANLRSHLPLPLSELQAFKARLTESNEAEQRAMLTAQLYQHAWKAHEPDLNHSNG